MSTIAERLAEACTSGQLETLPPEVMARTKDLLLDYLGVCWRGMLVESSQAVRAVFALSEPGQATIVGAGRSATAAWAALANGTGAHAIEMDDVTSKSSLHPAVAVWPAVLALGQELGAPAHVVLQAAVAGYEVMMRLGDALNPAAAYRRGFHPTGVAGAFGATAAAAILLRLDVERFTSALGIAGTMAAGSMEYLSGGAWTKRLNAGWAAHCGVVAGRLAEAGFSGPVSAIEGPLGFLHAFSEDPHAAQALVGLGESYQVMKVSIKPYACCRYNHGPIDCMLALRDSLKLEDIEEIQLGILSGGAPLVANPIERKRLPANVVDAQFSAPFAAAVALVHGKAGFEEYTQANVDDRRLQGLMAKTKCYSDERLDAVYPEHWPAAASVRLSDGRVLSAQQPYPLGEPENPVSPEALAGKFRQLVGLPWADEAILRIRGLPDGSIAGLMECFSNIAVTR